MGKRKTKMTNQEVLKHYTPGEGLPPASGPNLSGFVKELLDEASHAEFKKPVLAVDPVMANRKSAVMKAKIRKTKKCLRSLMKKR